MAQPVPVAGMVQQPGTMMQQQPGMMMPQQQMMMPQQQMMVMQQPMGGGRVPPGCPPGGNVKLVKYWGQTAWIICCIGNFLFGVPTCLCQPCCFCDKGEYYVLGQEYYTLSGARVSKPPCAQTD